MIKKLTIMLVLVVLYNSAYALPTAKLTIRATDNNNELLDNADVSVIFERAKKSGEGWGTNTYYKAGKTGSDGVFIVEGDTGPYVTIVVAKEGYYSASYNYKEFTGISGLVGFRKYEPWNPTVDIVLKKINNPIPMYAMKRMNLNPEFRLTVPALGEFVGFDLFENDWVVPYGQGTHNDFLIKVEARRANDFKDYDVSMTVSFSNDGDGVLKYIKEQTKGVSQLRMPYQAPVHGYTDVLIYNHKRKDDTLYYNPPKSKSDINYFFRVRTQKEKNGNVIGGYYGKIHGEITLDNYMWLHEQDPLISFTYYLNPASNDTNIEFDTTKNLFDTIPDRYQVSEP